MSHERKYAEVAGSLERQIRSGLLLPGEWVRVRQVADDYKVAVNTAALALRLLEATGYLVRVDGQSGYEVARHEHWRASPTAVLAETACPACGAALTAGLTLATGKSSVKQGV